MQKVDSTNFQCQWDYYPFGMLTPGRTWTAASSDEYRFGFNGKESDNEANGNSNIYDYGFRIYDPRVARFLSVDPLLNSYPYFSAYQFSGNNPIRFIDLDGLEQLPPPPPGGSTEISGGTLVTYDGNIYYFVPAENSNSGGMIGVYTENDGWYYINPDLYSPEPVVIKPQLANIQYDINNKDIQNSKFNTTLIKKGVQIVSTPFGIAGKNIVLSQGIGNVGNAYGGLSGPIDLLPFDFDDAVGGADQMLSYGLLQKALRTESNQKDFNKDILKINLELNDAGLVPIQAILLTKDQYQSALQGSLSIDNIPSNQIINPMDIDGTTEDGNGIYTNIIYFRNSGDGTSVPTGNLREYEIE